MTIERVSFDQNQDKGRGIDRVYTSFADFREQHDWQLAPEDPAPTRTDVRDAIGEIWDAVELAVPAIKQAISGPLQNADDEQTRVLVILVVLEKLNQYRGQLPHGGTL